MDRFTDILDEKNRASRLIEKDNKKYLLPEDNEIFTFEYPVLHYPEKVKSINLDKEPDILGKLSGIRGQYLIFEDNRVINIRKYSGYEIVFIS